MRRAALIACLLACLGATPAHAYWTASSGTGSGSAPVDALGAGNQPTAGATGQTVTVSFTQTSFHSANLGSFSGGGYTIRRYASTGGSAITPGGTCASTVSGSATTLSCTDSATPFGIWRYSVTPVLKSWTGAESAQSATVRVVPDAPPLTVAAAPAGTINLSWIGVTGATGYNVYRRLPSGSYTTTPLNGATPVTGTSYADTTGTNGTTYDYIVRAVAPASPSGTIESADSNEGSAQADATAPTAVTLTNPGTPLHGSVSFAATATDSGTGIAAVKVQYAPTGTTTWTLLCTATTSPYSCNGNTAAVTDGVYDLRAVATDNAGNQTASATVATRRFDNTAPTVSLTDPGQYLRATVSLTNTATDAGSGLATVKVQRSPAGAGTWTDICSTTTPAACSFNTTTVADGSYDLRVLATDAAGNQGTSVVSARMIDNTKPTGTDVETTNKAGGTAGKPEAGDTITYSFSEAMKPASILTGWTGTSTAVTVRISLAASSLLTVFDSANTTQLALGSVNTGALYELTAGTYAATMVMSGTTIVITLGTQSAGLATTAATAVAMKWTPSAAATDLAGNTMTTTVVTESGAADTNF